MIRVCAITVTTNMVETKVQLNVPIKIEVDTRRASARTATSMITTKKREERIETKLAAKKSQCMKLWAQSNPP